MFLDLEEFCCLQTIQTVFLLFHICFLPKTLSEKGTHLWRTTGVSWGLAHQVTQVSYTRWCGFSSLIRHIIPVNHDNANYFANSEMNLFKGRIGTSVFSEDPSACSHTLKPTHTYIYNAWYCTCANTCMLSPKFDFIRFTESYETMGRFFILYFFKHFPFSNIKYFRFVLLFLTVHMHFTNVYYSILFFFISLCPGKCFYFPLGDK